MTGTFAELHRKCMNGEGCTGPGCKITDLHINTAAPRLKTRPTKAERKLAVRVGVYGTHGKNPNGGQNPSNPHGTGHDMHKPGSHNLRNN